MSGTLGSIGSPLAVALAHRAQRKDSQAVLSGFHISIALAQGKGLPQALGRFGQLPTQVQAAPQGGGAEHPVQLIFRLLSQIVKLLGAGQGAGQITSRGEPAAIAGSSRARSPGSRSAASSIATSSAACVSLGPASQRA